MQNRLIPIVILTLLIVPSACSEVRPARTMAVTFDDLPFVNLATQGDGARLQATRKLLHSLGERKIPAIGFVNEIKLYEEGELIDARVEVLRAWLDADLSLGNHAYSHPDLHEVSLEQMKADVMRGEQVTRPLLARYGLELRFFRHPYLHTGRDLETKHAFESFLTNNDYLIAPVSIDNSEWIFARAYFVARRSGDEALAGRIGSDYVDYMLDMVEYYEGQSIQLFNRNIAHVLLVHANELNADWFAVLADRLSDLGYEFVSLDDALQDPAYKSADTYTGRGGITWLHRWAISSNRDPAMYRGEPTTPDYVRELTALPEHTY